MEARRRAREQKKRQLPRELAAVHLEEMGEAGNFDQTPHFGAIEWAALELGRELSREALEQASREVAAGSPPEAPYPTCGQLCEVTTKRRVVKGMGGPVELTEAVADCRRCRRSSFPSTRGDGAR
jgi:hypothetical protein